MSVDREKARTGLAEVRDAFAKGDWVATVKRYENAKGLMKGERALRLEAACLAARALTAQNDRSTARKLLQPLAAARYSKAAHYEFLARAFLDLKQYADAADACQQADEVRQAEAEM